MVHQRITQLLRSRAARYEALVRPHLDRLYRYARQLTQDEVRAEDLVQALLLKLYPRLDELEALDKPGPWMARALHNLFIDELRAGQRNPVELVEAYDEDFEAWPAPLAAAPDAVVERMLDGERLSAALAQLSPEHRAVVAWHDIEGYTLEELSRTHGIPLGTLKSRLHRARAHLRRLLAEPEQIAQRVRVQR